MNKPVGTLSITEPPHSPGKRNTCIGMTNVPDMPYGEYPVYLKQEPKMVWSRKTGPHESGESLHVGKWRVGSTCYDSGKSRDDPEKWAAHCTLPGIKPLLSHHTTEEEAKARVEKAVNHWMGGLNEHP